MSPIDSPPPLSGHFQLTSTHTDTNIYHSNKQHVGNKEKLVMCVIYMYHFKVDISKIYRLYMFGFIKKIKDANLFLHSDLILNSTYRSSHKESNWKYNSFNFNAAKVSY